MFWRMVGRTIFRQKSKMAMIAFTIALGISLSTAMMNVMFGIGDKVNRELKVYGANIRVMPKDASLLSDLYGLEGEMGVNDQHLYEEDILKIKSIFWGFNIVDFAPSLDTKIKVEGIEKPVTLVGTWMQNHLSLATGEEVDTGLRPLRNWWESSLEGDWLTAEDDEMVMVGSLLAGRNHLKVGDEMTLQFGEQSKKVKVKGIFLDGGESDEKIYSTLKTAQELTGLQGKVSKIEVSALTTPDNDLARRAAQDPDSLSIEDYDTWYCTAYVSAICHQIQDVVRESVAKPVRQVAESEGTILSKTQLLMLLIAILSSIGSALAISNLVTASVIERSQEIGLLKAIGAFDVPIIVMVVVEIFLTAIFGGIIGYFAGIGFAQIIGLTVFNSTIEINVTVIPIISVSVVLMTMIGCIPAIRYLLKLKPTEVLHGK
ncbi:MAG: ABC transporter permease [Eubacteriales bacterium]|nr:ABC transporter permease [Eubacteriales bacterium]